MANHCVWLSIDPVRCKVDFYPRPIAKRIEKAFQERDMYLPNQIVLGKDFFNATIHFKESGTCYQTTSEFSMGRAGFKPAGYRSVKRFNINLSDEYIDVYSKQISGEWRITEDELESQIKFHEKIDKNCVIETTLLNIENLKEWEPEHLNMVNPSDLNDSVVVWQWCRGIPEKQGNLMLLDDKWWTPYLYPQNKIIEKAFKEQENNINITIPFDDSVRRIYFNKDSCFGNQFDDINNKCRLIRRKIVTISEFQELIKNINVVPKSIFDILADLDDDSIPREFICCITQCIMEDPVKTVDGQTYDRVAILRWFEDNSTSPLTGLVLPNKELVQNVELKEQILQYTNLK
jgi:hypothetical protein